MRWLSLLTLILAACTGDTGETDGVVLDTDTDTDTDTDVGQELPNGVAAVFTVSGDAGSQDVVWEQSEGNLVFCRVYGPDVWIRLAEQAAADGENGPHVDIDVCKWGGGGTYPPMAADLERCPATAAFDVWWHAAGGAVWANGADASPCELTLTADGATLEGAFACDGLEPVFNATGTVSVRNGRFRCTVEEGN